MMQFTRTLPFALAVGLAATSGLAQETDFTTPEGAAVIHATLGSAMLSFQNQGENDLIYLTNLLAWRCGTASILYGFNDDAPITTVLAEPCYREFREPNVFQHAGEPEFPLWLTVPKESVQKITIRVLYEDGKMAEFVAERAKSLMP